MTLDMCETAKSTCALHVNMYLMRGKLLYLLKMSLGAKSVFVCVISSVHILFECLTLTHRSHSEDILLQTNVTGVNMT